MRFALALAFVVLPTSVWAQRQPRYVPNSAEIETAMRDPENWLQAGILVTLIFIAIMLLNAIEKLSRR
mgnify:CR=1 FL=1